MSAQLEKHYRIGVKNYEGPANIPFSNFTEYERKLTEGRDQQWHFLPICLCAFREEQSGGPLAPAPSFDELTEIERAALQLMEMLIREGPGAAIRLVEAEIIGKGVMDDLHVTYDYGYAFIANAVDAAVFRTKEGRIGIERHPDVTQQDYPNPVPWGQELIKIYHEIWPHIPDPAICD